MNIKKGDKVRVLNDTHELGFNVGEIYEVIYPCDGVDTGLKYNHENNWYYVNTCDIELVNEPIETYQIF